MVLDNVAVRWPRTGDYYEPVPPVEFASFAGIVDRVPPGADAAAALARRVAEHSAVLAGGYTGLVDLLLGLDGVLYATDSAAEDEDPVIDPDGCAWIAGGLERFVAAHRRFGEKVTFDTVAEVLRSALRDNRLAEQQLRWLDSRLTGQYDETGEPPAWDFALTELAVLAAFYRRCADRGFAVYARA